MASSPTLTLRSPLVTTTGVGRRHEAGGAAAAGVSSSSSSSRPALATCMPKYSYTSFFTSLPLPAPLLAPKHFSPCHPKPVTTSMSSPSPSTTTTNNNHNHNHNHNNDNNSKSSFTLRGAANSAISWLVWPATLATVLPAAPILLLYRWLKHRKPVIDPRGKVVLVTGASSGIGKEVAKEFARRGAKLFLCARREHLLEDLVQEVKALGSPEAALRRTDLKHEAECKAMVEECVRLFGGLDVLVVNAGVANMYFFEEAQSTIGFRDPFEVGLWGSVYPTYYALDALKSARGQILVTASVGSLTPYPRLSLYNGAKAAVFNFFDTLRVELRDSVGITLACPNFVRSGMSEGTSLIDAEGRQTLSPERMTEQRLGGLLPICNPTDMALAMVDAALARKRLLVFPSWSATFLLLRLFAPELQDLILRTLYVPRGARRSRTPVHKGPKSQ